MTFNIERRALQLQGRVEASVLSGDPAAFAQVSARNPAKVRTPSVGRKKRIRSQPRRLRPSRR
jgi:hypothetical protein